MRRTKFDTVAQEGQRPWEVLFHRAVGDDISRCGLDDTRFSPTLRELVDALEANPKQFPKKLGKLKNARAAHLRFTDVEFVAVFVLDEAARRVKVLSLDPHDRAYEKAVRRI
jgi:mRNA-degrading endonuclease RelE of RelBE toxin-antitoxin system